MIHYLEARKISKTYRFYPKPIDRLREAVLRRSFHQAVHSLSDISFTVPQGTSLGIIGDNGAGKSTLLKILAGTLTPSSGEIIKQGRVAALLELGSGFHPEFTGRQNIFLNASLMGLCEDEIREKESTIIEFAEIGDFIDRPLKLYSSGMTVRLAFSIATSVDPDILIVDEALSVGDQHFQKKSADRMIMFRDLGKIMIFCSHAMFLVSLLCQKAIWLDHGRCRMIGDTSEITAAYENHNRKKEAQDSVESIQHSAAPPVIIQTITLNGATTPIRLRFRDNLQVGIVYEAYDDRKFWLAVGIRRNDNLICHAVSMTRDVDQPLSGKGVGQVTLTYLALPFFHGEFAVVVHALDCNEVQCYHQKLSASFWINPPEQWNAELGLLDLPHEWQIG